MLLQAAPHPASAVCGLGDLLTHQLPNTIHPKENCPLSEMACWVTEGGEGARLTHVLHGRRFLGFGRSDHPRLDPDVFLFRNGSGLHLIHLVRFRFLVISLFCIVEMDEKNKCWDSTKMHFGKKKIGN